MYATNHPHPRPAGRSASGPSRSDSHSVGAGPRGNGPALGRRLAAPAIAQHLGYHAATVRTALKAYAAHGRAGLWHQRPGPPDVARREHVTGALDWLLDQPRTGTAPQLAQALRAEGILLSTRQTRRYVQGMGAKWRRTVRSLGHKQAPVKVERAKSVLAMLGKGRPRGSSNASTSMSAASARVCP